MTQPGPQSQPLDSLRIFIRTDGEPAAYCGQASKLAETRNAIGNFLEMELDELICDPGETRQIQLESKFMTDAEVDALPDL